MAVISQLKTPTSEYAYPVTIDTNIFVAGGTSQQKVPDVYATKAYVDAQTSTINNYNLTYEGMPTTGSGTMGSGSMFEGTAYTDGKVSGNMTFKPKGNQQNYGFAQVDGAISLSIAAGNYAANYLALENKSANAVSVTLGTISGAGGTTTTVWQPKDGISIPKDCCAEIGIYVNDQFASITVTYMIKATA